MSDQGPLRETLEGLREQPEQLIEIILRQAAAIQELQKQVAELKNQIRDLNDRNHGLSSKVEALEQRAARQDGPFRIADKQSRPAPKQPCHPRGHHGVHRSYTNDVEQQVK